MDEWRSFVGGVVWREKKGRDFEEIEEEWLLACCIDDGG